jgi:RNA polymerase sigma-70 factor (ECF subfamily)
MFSEMELIADNEAFEPFDDELDENMAIEPEFLMEMIQSLPDGYRTVFNLHVFEKWGHREIAESLGISEGTSKSQLAKARMMLKKRIEELLGAKRKLIMV